MSTAYKSVVGLKAVAIAELVSDTESATTYSAVEAIPGAIDLQISPNNADPDVQYADDDEFDVLNPDPEISVTLEATRLPLAIQKRIYNHTLDANGVIIKKSTDEIPYFALGFKAATRSGTDIYVWLYKGRAKPLSETFHTKEGGTITRQTGKIEFTFIRRQSDKAYQVVAEDNKNGFAGGATFLNTVYETTPATVTELHALTWALTAPVEGATPETTMNDTGYTGAVTWSPTAAAFVGETVYIATVVIKAAAGYVFCPSFGAASIASLPVGATVTREGDTTVTVTVAYTATAA